MWPRARSLLFSAVIAACAAAGASSFVLASSCAPRARMCGTPNACAATDVCVAGRCQPLDGGAPAIDETNDAGYVVRRLLVAPVDVAWVRRGDRAAAAMPAVFTLGRESDGDAMLFTRFALTLPRDASIVEAYLLLSRSDAVDADPAPISLHAVRIVDPWDSRTISWAAQPRTEEVRAPTTRVDPAGRALVRIDVRALVERWAQHARHDQGIAVVAENSSPSGLPFAFLPVSAPRAASNAPSPPAALPFGALDRPPLVVDLTPELPGAVPASPRLELYVK